MTDDFLSDQQIPMDPHIVHGDLNLILSLQRKLFPIKQQEDEILENQNCDFCQKQIHVFSVEFQFI